MPRADDLLRQMTVEEKAMQLSCVVPLAILGPDGPMRSEMDKLLGQGIGHVAATGLLPTSGTGQTRHIRPEDRAFFSTAAIDEASR
jgi:hypothetical protein